MENVICIFSIHRHWIDVVWELYKESLQSIHTMIHNDPQYLTCVIPMWTFTTDSRSHFNFICFIFQKEEVKKGPQKGKKKQEVMKRKIKETGEKGNKWICISWVFTVSMISTMKHLKCDENYYRLQSHDSFMLSCWCNVLQSSFTLSI